jgi:hypothetical protein
MGVTEAVMIPIERIPRKCGCRMIRRKGVSGEIRAPSTLGSFLWSFTWGNVRQLDAVARQAGCTGKIVFRIDLAYYSAAVPGAIRATGACFSVTVRMDPKIRAAIAAIPRAAWTPEP